MMGIQAKFKKGDYVEHKDAKSVLYQIVSVNCSSYTTIKYDVVDVDNENVMASDIYEDDLTLFMTHEDYNKYLDLTSAALTKWEQYELKLDLYNTLNDEKYKIEAEEIYNDMIQERDNNKKEII